MPEWIYHDSNIWMGVAFLNCVFNKQLMTLDCPFFAAKYRLTHVYSVECNFNKAGKNSPHIDNLRDYKTCIFNKYKQTIILYTCDEIHIWVEFGQYRLKNEILTHENWSKYETKIPQKYPAIHA